MNSIEELAKSALAGRRMAIRKLFKENAAEAQTTYDALKPMLPK